jgi:16S rRNA G966 N2-methylase RsmD
MKMTQYLKWKEDLSKGEVFTPIGLVKEMLDKIPDEVWRNPNATFLDPCMGKGTFLLEIVRRLVYIYGYTEDDAKSRVYGYDIRVKYINHLQRRGLKNVRHKDFLNEIIEMEFDVVLGNPPYTKDVGGGNSVPLWDKFIEKSFIVCKENGYISLIHPNGWRNIKGSFKKLQKLILSKDIKYLELHSTEDGQMVFGVTTPFDVYVIKNTNQTSKKTIVKDYDGVVSNQDLSKLEFIPNSKFDIIKSLLASDEEEKVEVIEDSSYHHQREYVSSNLDNTYQYPCVYSVYKDGSFNLKYSSRNDKGHFGKSKLILGNGANPTVFMDVEGDYGMTQFAFGIVDTPENLIKIKKAYGVFAIEEEKKLAGISVKTVTDTETEKQRLLKQTNRVIQQEFQNLFENLANTYADAIVAIANGGDPLQTLFNGILLTVSSFMDSFGKAILSVGVALLKLDVALKSLNPFLAIAGGVALIAAAGVARSMAQKGVTPFADGGIVSGPTLGLVGEYPGASTNPEVIAPLDKLQKIIGTNGSQDGGFIAETRISGRDLAIVLNRYNKDLQRG